MAESIDLTAQEGIEVVSEEFMPDRLAGEWRNTCVVMACRDCVALEAAVVARATQTSPENITPETMAMVKGMARADVKGVPFVLDGSGCAAPQRKLFSRKRGCGALFAQM